MAVTNRLLSSAILGIDVGATKTRWIIYEMAAGEVTHNVIADGTYLVVPPLRDVKSDLAAVFKFASKLCVSKGVDLSAVGIGFPRRFGADYIIKPSYSLRQTSTAANDEYAGKNIFEIFRESIPDPMPLAVLNDAGAHLEGIIGKKMNEADGSAALAGKTVGLISPGTSLGGGFAIISPKGEVERITDGHICDMMIEMPAQDIAFLNQKNSEFLLERRIRGNHVEAASVLSGRGLTRVLGTRGESFELENLSDEHQHYVDIAAQVMARIIHNIRTKNIVKRDENQQWPECDKAAASTTSIFFISGGMGTSLIGDMIFNRAKNILMETYNDIQLTKESENMAPYGACLVANRLARHAIEGPVCG